MSQAILEQLRARFGEAIIETHNFRGDETAIVRREQIVPLCQWLKATPGIECNMLIDLCGVDYSERAERFEVVYHLYSTTQKHRVRVKVRLAGEAPQVDSVVAVWPAANWFEREAFDLFGITFVGHPHLKRLLTFDEFEGHPLRKDYPVNRRPKIPTPDPLM
ncbi:MAG: NADH-quinone oxidoreductase subunit C [Deltaproteobacteria bacterium]|nr:NADH-quinone oxidoreductase subunit C [Deltaproteobacteria bacterium]